MVKKPLTHEILERKFGRVKGLNIQITPYLEESDEEPLAKPTVFIVFG